MSLAIEANVQQLVLCLSESVLNLFCRPVTNNQFLSDFV